MKNSDIAAILSLGNKRVRALPNYADMEEKYWQRSGNTFTDTLGDEKAALVGFNAIELPINNSLRDDVEVATGDITVAMWFKQSTPSTNSGLWLVGNSSNYRIAMWSSAQQLGIGYTSPTQGSVKTLTTGYNITLGTWYHLVLRWVGESVYLHISTASFNSTPVYSSATNGVFTTSAGGTIGYGGYADPGGEFHGNCGWTIATAGVWERNLSDSDMELHFNSGIPSNPISFIANPTAIDIANKKVYEAVTPRTITSRSSSATTVRQDVWGSHPSYGFTRKWETLSLGGERTGRYIDIPYNYEKNPVARNVADLFLYVENEQHPEIANGWNGADCWIEFDPDGSGGPLMLSKNNAVVYDTTTIQALPYYVSGDYWRWHFWEFNYQNLADTYFLEDNISPWLFKILNATGGIGLITVWGEILTTSELTRAADFFGGYTRQQILTYYVGV